VGIVDALVVYLVVAYFDPGGGSAYPDTRAVALAAMLLVYMAVATANAVRIYVRGRSNSSPHSVALRRSEPPAATGFVDVGPPPELDAPPLIDERRQE
jgi:hypothetical protein